MVLLSNEVQAFGTASGFLQVFEAQLPASLPAFMSLSVPVPVCGDFRSLLSFPLTQRVPCMPEASEPLRGKLGNQPSASLLTLLLCASSFVLFCFNLKSFLIWKNCQRLFGVLEVKLCLAELCLVSSQTSFLDWSAQVGDSHGAGDNPGEWRDWLSRVSAPGHLQQ